MGQSVSYDSIPDLRGKVAIVTGASAGIGVVTATELARKGAHVFVCGRSEARTTPVVQQIKAETKNDLVEFGSLDLASLESVNKFANAFLARQLPLHILVNNAGIMATPFELSKDGIEMQFATNHFGHFLLTQRLLPALEKSQPSRIVNVSSLGHKLFPASDGIHFDDLNDEKKYKPYVRYGETKLANVLFARELQRRLDAKGANQIYVNSCHPGNIATTLAYNAAYMGKVVAILASPFLISVPKGAYTSTYLAAHPDVEAKGYKGRYFVPYGQLAEPSAAASNPDHALRTYEWTERILREKLGDKYQSAI